MLAHELSHVVQQQKQGPSLQRKVNPDYVACNKYPRSYPIFKYIGTDDPVGVIQVADETAIQLIDDTISILQAVQQKVIGGELPAVPTFSNCLAESMSIRLLLDPENKDTWQKKTPKTINHYLNMLQNIKDHLTGGGIHYNCKGVFCDDLPSRYAVSIPGGKYRIGLCEPFWKRSSNVLRALILIHEISHIYYETKDSGRGMGNAHCINGFIADVNGVKSEIPSVGDKCRNKSIQSC